MSKNLADIARHPARAAVVLALLLRAALVFVIARDTFGASDVANFEIDDTSNALSPGDSVPLKASYYSGVFDTGDGPAGDDWAQGPSQDGIFVLSPSDPDTAATNCYGS